VSYGWQATRRLSTAARRWTTTHRNKLTRINDINDGIEWVMSLWMRITIVMSAVALLLSPAAASGVMRVTAVHSTHLPSIMSWTYLFEAPQICNRQA